jgi:hypothetical protein
MDFWKKKKKKKPVWHPSAKPKMVYNTKIYSFSKFCWKSKSD